MHHIIMQKEKESEYELEQKIKRKEAESREIILEMTGDIPNAMVMTMFGCYYHSSRSLLLHN
jgi:hypothetical protein